MLNNFKYKNDLITLSNIDDFIIMDSDSFGLHKFKPLSCKAFELLVKKNHTFLQTSKAFAERILNQLPKGSSILILDKQTVVMGTVPKNTGSDILSSFKITPGVNFQADYVKNPVSESLKQGKITVCENVFECLISNRHWTLVTIPIFDCHVSGISGALAFLVPNDDYNPLMLQLFKITCDLISLSLARVSDVEEVQNYFEQMFGSLAHEIKNMLTTIRGFVQLLNNSEIDPRDSTKSGYTSFILSELDRAHNILKNSIFYSNGVDQRVNICKISDIIHDVISNLHAVILNSNIKLELNISTDIPPITGDSTQFRQVFLNIIQNAIEAMPNGGTLTINCYFNNLQIYTSIKDSGVGMPANIKQKIFQPFFSTKHAGTGLGLSVSKQVIEQYKGQIYVTSSKNKGTSFTIILPT